MLKLYEKKQLTLSKDTSYLQSTAYKYTGLWARIVIFKREFELEYSL